MIETSGAGAHGVLADTSGAGATTAKLDGGKVTTTHVSTASTEFTYGLWAQIKNEMSEATAMAVVTNGGEVSTASDHGFGLYAHTKGKGGAAVAQLDGGSKVTTTGSTAHGLHATNEVGRDASNNFITTEGQADMEVSVFDGTIETSGNYAFAAFANSIGLGASLVKMEGGTIITKGLTAPGLFAAINNTTSEAEVKAHMMERDGKQVPSRRRVNMPMGFLRSTRAMVRQSRRWRTAASPPGVADRAGFMRWPIIPVRTTPRRRS
ncbi:hypothetical protein [Yoonia sp. R2-816]|uniref:hypothetical protein n=1 Tax=Yoonia sp. R2-816 TaxID=3342638 RepID=UPI0037283AF5